MLHAFLALSIPAAVLLTVGVVLFTAIDEMFFQEPRRLRARAAGENLVKLPAPRSQPAERDSVAV